MTIGDERRAPQHRAQLEEVFHARARAEDPFDLVLKDWLDVAAPWAEAIRRTRGLLLRVYEEELDKLVEAAASRRREPRLAQHPRRQPPVESPPDKPNRAA